MRGDSVRSTPPRMRQAGSFHIGDAWSFFLTSASKFNIEPNGGIFDVSPKNDCPSPNVKILSHESVLRLSAADLTARVCE